MSKILVTESTHETVTVDQDGTEISRITESETHKTKDLGEPDYIKLYIDHWLTFQGIKGEKAQALFFEIVVRMSYADATDPTGGQTVYLGGQIATAIMAKIDVKKSMYHKLIAQLVDCGAIRRLSRGLYQVNPSFAGRGEWRYNPKKQRGGIENLVAKFDYVKGTVDTNIVWADNGEETALNEIYREGLGVKASEYAMLQETHIDTRSEEVQKQDAALPFEDEFDQEEKAL